jgi:hypothetical protein
MDLFNYFRRQIPVEIFTRMQVQHGESEEKVGPDFDFPHGSSGILRRMGSAFARKSSRS